MCSEEQFLTLYNKHIKIICSASLRYGSHLSCSEREQCGRIGLWKAIEEFDENKSQLSSFIYNKVKYECLQERRSYAKQTRDLVCSGLMEEQVEASNNISDKLSDPFLDMRLRRGFTFKEMGRACGVSLDVARNRYLQSIENYQLAARNGS